MKKNLKLLCAVYLNEIHLEDLLIILKSESTSKTYFLCLNVNEFLFQPNFIDLYTFVRLEPLKCRIGFENATLAVQNYLLANHSDAKKHKFVKKRVKIYFSLSSPRSEIVLNRCEGEFCQKTVLNQLVFVKGRVVKVSTPKMVQIRKQYRCRECGNLFDNDADFEQFYSIIEPKICPASDACGSIRFEEISTNNKKVTVTESDRTTFLIPKRTTVVLEDDLVDMCQMSDVVAITGILRQRWQPFVKGIAPKVELALHATWISKLNDVKQIGSSSMIEMKQKFENFWSEHKEQPLIGRDIILASVCPDIYEMYLVKLALMLILIGGVSGVTSSGTTIRGDPHLLLVGDPGTGKSKFLKHAANLAKRSTYSTGVGITSAGLTCAAVKVDGDWQLEPGALPLSHGGVCCIDEFHTLSESDRASVREAMETQGVSVAKAGVKTNIPCRCAVIAAMNQPEKYNNRSKYIDAPLLSRFDLVLTLNADRNDENFDHDQKIAKFLTDDVDNNAKDDQLWNQEMIKTYIACVKELSPMMSESAEKLLSQYFEFQRNQSFSRDEGKMTNRLRDGLIRLAQAHARLMYRTTVSVQDALMAVFMIDCSMLGTELLEPVDVLHTYFPNDPSLDYAIKGKLMLDKLHLDFDLQSNDVKFDRRLNFDDSFLGVMDRLRSSTSTVSDEPNCLSSQKDFDDVMTQIRCKEDVKATPVIENENASSFDRLKQFEFSSQKHEKRLLDDDDDLKIDLNELVWCSSKRKKSSM